MAKARLIRGDQSSAEFDQLRKTVNSLLLILENAATLVAASETAENVIRAIGEGIAAGVDNDPGGRVTAATTGLEIVGLKPTAKHPTRPGFVAGENLTDIDTASDL